MSCGGQGDPRDEASCDNTEGPVKMAKVISPKCIKCLTETSRIMFRAESLCWSCFDTLWLRKFKSCLLRCRPNRNEALVCAVALSGSIPSAVLLDLLHRTQHQTRMVMHPIHIDTSNVYKATEEARKERIQQVKQIGAKYNQNVEIYPIEDFFPLESLQSAMKSLKTNTSKEDFMSYVVKQALVVVAKSKKCNKLIVSSNGTNLAVKFMTSFCKGNGYQATQLISYATELDSGLTLSQPMRDYLVDKEIAQYYYVNKLSCWATVPKSSVKSINQLTQDFIVSLQHDFAQTVHTLLRSGDKLDVNKADTATCNLCLSLLSPSDLSQGHQRCYGCRILEREDENGSLKQYRRLTEAEMSDKIKEFILE